jgi:hypothetical protein
LTAGVIVLALVSFALTSFLWRQHVYHETSALWSKTIMYLLFGSVR